jgi:hypothetical protein
MAAAETYQKEYENILNTAFNTLILNGELYRLDTSIKESKYSQISDIDMFMAFITNTHYQGAGGSACPYITGTMYIHNTTPVDELVIRQ